MRARSALPAFACTVVAMTACAPIEVSTQVGYAQIAVAGDLALTSAAAGSRSSQDIGRAFGLGDERGSPWGRAAVDFGMPALSVSGFWLHEAGSGVLTEPFGGLPPGTAVRADLDLGSFKVVAACELELGPLRVAPGLLVDVFALDFRASTSPGNAEEIDEIVAVPMPSLRLAGTPLAGCEAAVEVGWLDASHLLDNDVRFFDVEAAVAWRPGGSVQLAGGYRWLHADAAADTATDSIEIDLQLGGWFVDVGVRF